MKKIALTLTLLLTAAGASAQADEQQAKDNEFGVSAQLRSRAEYRNGAISPATRGPSRRSSSTSAHVSGLTTRAKTSR